MTVEELAKVETIDLTTIGRSSGQPRRIEIWWFYVDGRFIITGTPGPRDWLANVQANPKVIVHVAGIDLTAIATPISDLAERTAVISDPQTSWYTTQAEFADLVDTAPMISIAFDPNQLVS